jgi:hypothetical protein
MFNFLDALQGTTQTADEVLMPSMQEMLHFFQP